jgi:NADP-dependent 3-hydroxy acid dehydrogenase YdfG
MREWKIMASDRLARRAALVTGSTSGIGEATTPLLRAGDGSISTASREVDVEPDRVM